MWRETGYNDAAVRRVSYDCGSATAKKSYVFFRRMNYVAKDKVWSKVWFKDGSPVAFYYANRCRDHVWLIEIAVRQDYQKQGLGRKLCYRLLEQMKRAGLGTLTFKTPISEDAQFFWQKMGAKIIDIKGSDYEMELKITI